MKVYEIKQKLLEEYKYRIEMHAHTSPASICSQVSPKKAAVTKKIADKYGLPLIELQPAFDEACKKAPREYWSADGVHPTACGHEIIKRLWIEAFEKIK